MKIEKCLGCGSADYHFISQSEGFTESNGGFIFEQEKYSIQKCHQCGLYFKNNILDSSKLNDYYNSFDLNNWSSEVKFPTEEEVEKYLTRLPARLKIFDYGCSDGRFISRFLHMHDCYGFDINQTAIKAALDRGIIMLDNQQLKLNGVKFDIILIADVFEHLICPTEVLEQLSSYLVENGVLIISTGLGDSKYCKKDMANFWYFKTVQHFSMISNEYVEYLKTKLGFSLHKRKVCSHYKVRFTKKLFYWLRINLYFLVTLNKKNDIIKLFSNIPFIKKIVNWKEQPYYPYSKDHVVLILKKINSKIRVEH